MLALCSGLAFADAPQVANSIDKTAESVAPAFTNPYKDVGNIPVTFPNQPPLVPHSIRGFQVTKNANQCFVRHVLRNGFQVREVPPLLEQHPESDSLNIG